MRRTTLSILLILLPSLGILSFFGARNISKPQRDDAQASVGAVSMRQAPAEGRGVERQASAPAAVTPVEPKTSPLASRSTAPDARPAAEERLTAAMLASINAMDREKDARTPTQRKIDSQLLFADKMRRGVPIAEGVDALTVDLERDAKGRVKVDLKAKVSQALLQSIADAKGEVLDSHDDYGSVRAWLGLEHVEAIAGRSDVAFVHPAAKATTHVGSVTSRGVYTHQANVAASKFAATGKGMRVGVLSDSIDQLANAQALGDLGPVTVLTNRFGKRQDGVPASGEGTAMLEIVHDMAPDAQLFYATAVNGEASFAQNIKDLRFKLGCDVIVDDVGYFREATFQDGIIAQAVEAVVADGCLYFSAAGNSGSKDHGTSGTWEGDFVDSGEMTASGGRIHKFPSGSANKVLAGGSKERVDFFWSDPLGGSTSDYDLYVYDSANKLVGSSTNDQTGAQDAYESIDKVSPGQRIVVVKRSGQGRFLHLEVNDGRLLDNTPGRIRGHEAAVGAVAVAAVNVATVGPTSPFVAGAKCPVEDFSSDGPRRVFFRPDGTAITPGNFSSTGGVLRQKPDIAAANGVATTLPLNEGLNPFFGTSAAAPHAAAIAALVKSYNPDLSPAQVRAAMVASALDNESPGFDRNAGQGIVMADRAIQSAGPPTPLTLSNFSPASGAIGQPVEIQGAKLEGVTHVTFNGRSASFVIRSPSTLTAIVPVGASTGPIAIASAASKATSTTSFVVLPTPVLLSATPSSGGPGTTVRLQGANLSGTTKVQFNDVDASFSQVSDTELRATVPLAASTGPVSVQTPKGSTNSPWRFVVIPSPVITAFAPTSGGVGTQVILTGANLGQLTSARFNNTPATWVVNSPGQITLTVPPGATTGPISVASAQGTNTTSTPFTVLPIPLISSFFPTNAPEGEVVALLGTNFTEVASVSFNGAQAEFVALTDSLIVALVPPGATTGPISASNPSGTGATATSFVIMQPPSNDAFDKPAILVGASGSITNSNRAATRQAGEPVHASNPGGRSVWYQWTAPDNGVWKLDLSGSSFDTLLAVYSGTNIAGLTPITSNDDASATNSTSRLLFTAIKGASYRFAVDGFNSSQGEPYATSSGSLKLTWSIEALAPAITRMSTNRGRAGDSVTINGFNLANSPSVAFNNVPATILSATSTQLRVRIPASATDGTVTVTTTGGTVTAPTPFTIIVPPDNDWFAGAKDFGTPNGMVSVSTIDASREAGEPQHAGNLGGRSVWYRWTAPRSGLFLFETTGSSFDTVLAAYSGNTLASLVPVVANDDAGALVTSRILINAVASRYYNIAIDGAEGASGNATLRWTEVGNKPVITDFTPLDGGIQSLVTVRGANLTNVSSIRLGGTKVESFTVVSADQIRFRVPVGSTNGVISIATSSGTAESPGAFQVTDAPSNDDFASAAIMSVGSYQLRDFNNSKATFEDNEPRHAREPGGKSLWYSWSPPSSGLYAIDTDGSGFDTTLAVYTGSVLSTNMTVVASNDEFGRTHASRVEFYASTNVQYKIAVDGYRGASGQGFLRIQPAVAERISLQTSFGPEQGYFPYIPLGGQNGWTSTGTGGNGVFTKGLPWGGQQGYIGIDGTGVEVRKPLGIVPDSTRSVIRFDMDFAIYDSTNWNYDGFRIRFYNRSNQRLFTIGLNNFDGSMYSIGDSTTSPQRFMPVTFVNSRIYHLAVVMDFKANRWSAYLDDSLVEWDQPISDAGATLDLDAVALAWVPRNLANPGNNYMVFDNYKVTSMPNPRPSVAAMSQSTTVTEGVGTVLAVVANGTPPFAYQWLRDGVAIPGANKPLLRIPSADAGDLGNYSVRIINDYGWLTSSTVFLDVVPLGLAMEAGGMLRIQGAPGQRVRIEFSTDLKVWSFFESATTGPDRTVRVNGNVQGRSAGFYRVVLE